MRHGCFPEFINHRTFNKVKTCSPYGTCYCSHRGQHHGRVQQLSELESQAFQTRQISPSLNF